VPANAVEPAAVSKSLGGVSRLQRLDLQVPAGTVFGLLGPNGAGKTTTLRILLGLLQRDAGSISVLGLDPARDGQRIREQVGVLLETDGPYHRLSATQNLAFHARAHRFSGALASQRIEEGLRAFGLWDRRKELVSTWSKGMRQKLAVARALLHKPRLLLLDEPFSGLDPMAASELRGRIVDLAGEGGATVLLTTHDLSHVEKACSEVAVLHQGRITANLAGRVPTPFIPPPLVVVGVLLGALSSSLLTSAIASFISSRVAVARSVQQIVPILCISLIGLVVMVFGRLGLPLDWPAFFRIEMALLGLGAIGALAGRRLFRRDRFFERR